MDIITIIIVVAGIGLFLFLLLIDNAFGKLIDWLFSMLGLQSGKGPLVARAVTDDERLLLTLENRGNHKLMLAAVEGRDGRQKFPKPFLDGRDFPSPSAGNNAHKQFAKIVLDPGESRTVILDTNGHAWPVEGFNAAARG